MWGAGGYGQGQVRRAGAVTVMGDRFTPRARYESQAEMDAHVRVTERSSAAAYWAGGINAPGVVSAGQQRYLQALTGIMGGPVLQTEPGSSTSGAGRLLEGGAPGRPGAVAEPLAVGPFRGREAALIEPPLGVGLARPVVRRRQLPEHPVRVLSVEGMPDDYYTSTIAMSSARILVVSLGESVYLYDEKASRHDKLVHVGDAGWGVVEVTATEWMPRNQVTLGRRDGVVSLWDAHTRKELRRIGEHETRVAALRTRGSTPVVAASAAAGSVVLYDVRSASPGSAGSMQRRYADNVCSFEWSGDGNMLAVGYNDNMFALWDTAKMSAPLAVVNEHSAAVRALAWSPLVRGILATGGGTEDRALCFWNTASPALASRQDDITRALGSRTGSVSGAGPMASFDTGSQVCCIRWSEHTNEIAIGRGYGDNYNIGIVSAVPIQLCGELKHHADRVLHMVTTPDGQQLVSASADGTLCFWDAFVRPPIRPASATSDDYHMQYR